MTRTERAAIILLIAVAFFLQHRMRPAPWPAIKAPYPAELHGTSVYYRHGDCVAVFDAVGAKRAFTFCGGGSELHVVTDVDQILSTWRWFK